jgi:hypothetical protein
MGWLTLRLVMACIVVPWTGIFQPALRLARELPATFIAYAGMQQLDHDFNNARLGFYVVAPDKYGPSAALWPTSQILQAAISLAQVTRSPDAIARVRRNIASLRFYQGAGNVYHTRAAPSRRYTDDNNWIALDLLDAYDLLHDASYLTEAEHIFNFAVSFWDRSGGGVLWGEGQT